MTSGTVVYTGGGIGMSAGPKISATEKVRVNPAGAMVTPHHCGSQGLAANCLTATAVLASPG
jgi:hypothetical protein